MLIGSAGKVWASILLEVLCGNLFGDLLVWRFGSTLVWVVGERERVSNIMPNCKVLEPRVEGDYVNLGFWVWHCRLCCDLFQKSFESAWGLYFLVGFYYFQKTSTLVHIMSQKIAAMYRWLLWSMRSLLSCFRKRWSVAQTFICSGQGCIEQVWMLVRV